MSQNGEFAIRTNHFSRNERDEIRKLFGFHKSLVPSEPEPNDLAKYRAKTAITRKMIKNQRAGQAAGTKDVLVVGPQVKSQKKKNSLPPFTPADCGHNFGKRRTKE